MQRIDRAFVMRHEHVAGALGELMEVGKTSSGPDGILSRKAGGMNLLKNSLRWSGIVCGCLLVFVVSLLLFFRVVAAFREVQTPAQAAPAFGRFVHADDVDIFMQEVGPSTGPAVLLIHGTGAWSELWRETMTALGQAGFHTIAIDVPPFGYSQKPTNAAYRRQDQAKRIVGVIKALQLPQVTLVGHSFGAGPTLETARMTSQNIAKLILVDAALGLDASPTRGGVGATLLHAMLAIRPLRNALVASSATNAFFTGAMLRQFITKQPAATPQRIRMLQAPLVVEGSTDAVGYWLQEFLLPTTASLPTEHSAYTSLTMPVLVIWGAEDTVTPLPQAWPIAGLLSNAQVVVLQDIGHIPQIEDPHAFTTTLLAFLRSGG